ncbi:MAG: thioredoxin domain-containing protein [Anaerolineales bacterium]
MNRLSQSSSPYLLQHANNPVDWRPWGEEALQKAKEENKPIFLSIGYAACHWCHVMARESFEDAETAALMNELFINIKVDKEERPDIDEIYMQVAIAMTGSGGWPLSVFLSPDLKPFYAGTYFPPVPRYNMPSFKDLLRGLANAWKNERAEVEKIGGQVFDYLKQSQQSEPSIPLIGEHYQAIADSILKAYDWGYGGWGSAPKFPQPMVIEFLLAHDRFTENAKEESPYIKACLHALRAMSRGGMYDVVGGGFSRYSTDNFWRTPHFEKMLYDNALLLRAYLRAWQISGDAQFKRIVTETIDFIEREMTDPQGGFYSSLDADSEHEEGKFYVWTLDNIREVLQEDAKFFEAAYGITARGNWEGQTILQRALDDATLAARFKLTGEELTAHLKESHRKLLAARANRTRPATDDKILAAWNGLMLAALAETARVFSAQTKGNLAETHAQSEQSLNLATRCAEFLLTEMRPNRTLRRSWRGGKTTNEAFLEDYAALIMGLLELYQTDFNVKWFAAAQELTEDMLAKFYDEDGGFFDAPNNGEALPLRPKDLQDNAVPSGNALACEALLKMYEFTGNEQYRSLAERALRLVSGAALRAPLGFARWLAVGELATQKTQQVAIVRGVDEENFEALIQIARAEYSPRRIVAAGSYPPPAGAPNILSERAALNGRTTAYICEGFVCKQPITDVDLFEIAMREGDASLAD